MAGGEFLTARERQTIDKAIRRAEKASRYEFSVFVGTAEARAPTRSRLGCTGR